MKFNPHTNKLFTDEGRLIKRLHCPFRLDWNKLGPMDDPNSRLCDICQHAVTDTAHLTETLTWLRDTLSQAALRHGRWGEARLVKLHLAGEQRDCQNDYPALEEFRVEHDPEGFYREDELIQLYLQTFPQAADKKVGQRRRLL